MNRSTIALTLLATVASFGCRRGSTGEAASAVKEAPANASSSSSSSSCVAQLRGSAVLTQLMADKSPSDVPVNISFGIHASDTQETATGIKVEVGPISLEAPRVAAIITKISSYARGPGDQFAEDLVITLPQASGSGSSGWTYSAEIQDLDLVKIGADPRDASRFKYRLRFVAAGRDVMDPVSRTNAFEVDLKAAADAQSRRCVD